MHIGRSSTEAPSSYRLKEKQEIALELLLLGSVSLNASQIIPTIRRYVERMIRTSG